MDAFIIVAPQDYPLDIRADFVCSGRNDELTNQRAIDLAVKERKNIMLLNGVYHIDGFHNRYGDNGPDCAICLPIAWREIQFLGQNNQLCTRNFEKNGVVLYVSKKALKKIKGETDVIRGQWTDAGIQNGSSLRMEDISVVLANNQHKIRCIDLRRTDRVEVKNIYLCGYGDDAIKSAECGLINPPTVAAEGCIGLTMTDGSNNSFSNYVNIQVGGFDEGIQVGGEHVVMINCAGHICRYGYTFGNYKTNCGSNHPITLINCMDERNINLPLFNACGDHTPSGEHLQGRQEVTFVSFNIERIAKQTPGGELGDLMREVYPGTWCGNIDFTAQPAWSALNSIDFQLWENDGSGVGIKTRNNCHKAICTTAERLSYYPMYGQQIFDTDLNKMVICIDPEHKKWVDFSGERV